MIKLLLGTTLTSLLMVAQANQSTSISGIGLDRTRVIIKDGANSGSFGLINDIGNSVIVTSWITELDGKPSNSFIVSPSIYQLSNGKTGKGSIRLISDLPQDRESVFWLSVNTAPANKNNKNQLSVAIGTRIKVFYRPNGLDGDAKFAAKQLKWSYDKDSFIVENPSALSVSVSHISLNGQEIAVGKMVLPFSTNHIKFANTINKTSKVSFVFIDEYGSFNELPMKLGDH